MKLSIVIPVYNVEQYLFKCLCSCLNQGLEYKDYEIIIIDDGSTDNSLRIAQHTALQNKNIKVFSQPNRGQSVARNKGISLARGEYIWFVDSDDWLEPCVAVQLYKQVSSNNLDCIWFRWRRVDSNGRLFVDSSDNTRMLQETCVESGVSFLENRFGYACYSCAFWFRREFLRENSFFFKEGVIFEDTELIPRILLKAKYVKYSSLLCYNYFMRQGSSIKSVSDKKYNDLKLIIHNINDFKTLEANEYFDRLFSSLVVLGIKLVASESYRKYRSDYLQLLTKLSRNLIVYDNSLINSTIVRMMSISSEMTLAVLSFIRKMINR